MTPYTTPDGLRALSPEYAGMPEWESNTPVEVGEPVIRRLWATPCGHFAMQIWSIDRRTKNTQLYMEAHVATALIRDHLREWLHERLICVDFGPEQGDYSVSQWTDSDCLWWSGEKWGDADDAAYYATYDHALLAAVLSTQKEAGNG